jgi:hypothetical protein
MRDNNEITMHFCSSGCVLRATSFTHAYIKLYYHLLIHFRNVDWLIFLQITGENIIRQLQITGANNGLSMRTFEINSQLQNIDLHMHAHLRFLKSKFK